MEWDLLKSKASLEQILRIPYEINLPLRIFWKSTEFNCEGYNYIMPYEEPEGSKNDTKKWLHIDNIKAKSDQIK